jgi:hypothetical protein
LTNNSSTTQLELCLRVGAEYSPVSASSKLGIALNLRQGIVPINGLRHNPVGTTNGWYIWGGEKFSDAPDFFHPLHVSHLHEWCPQVEKYLALGPGWRFLIADGYEDIWFDPSLVENETDD